MDIELALVTGTGQAPIAGDRQLGLGSHQVQARHPPAVSRGLGGEIEPAERLIFQLKGAGLDRERRQAARVHVHVLIGVGLAGRFKAARSRSMCVSEPRRA